MMTMIPTVTITTRHHWIQCTTFTAETNAACSRGSADTHTDTQTPASQYLLRSLSGGEGNATAIYWLTHRVISWARLLPRLRRSLNMTISWFRTSIPKSKQMRLHQFVNATKIHQVVFDLHIIIQVHSVFSISVISCRIHQSCAHFRQQPRHGVNFWSPWFSFAHIS